LAQGQEADIELNASGLEQVKKTANYLKKYRSDTKNGNFDCLYVSPMKRTVDTANIISKIVNCNNIIVDSRLLERKQGKASGLSDKDELSVAIKEEEKKLKNIDPIKTYIDNDKIYTLIDKKFNIKWEIDKDIQKRALECITDIINTNYKKIIIVSHGGLLSALIKVIFKIPIVPLGDVKTYGSNCFISLIKHDKINGYTMISPPDTTHLGL